MYINDVCQTVYKMYCYLKQIYFWPPLSFIFRTVYFKEYAAVPMTEPHSWNIITFIIQEHIQLFEAYE